MTYCENRNCPFTDCEKHLSKCRSTKQTAWIPCSERLPENIKTVLVTLKGMKQPTIGWYGNINGWRLSEKDFCGIENEVIAWMPLPEPYKKCEKM